MNQARQELLGATQGTVSVEYALLLVLVAVGLCAAIYGLGLPLLARYRLMVALISLPIP